MKSLMKNNISLKLAFSFVLLSFVSCQSGNDVSIEKESANTTNVRVKTIQYEDISIEKNFYADVNFSNSYTSVAELSGWVKTLNIHTGKQVKQGDILISYPPVNFNLQTAQAQLVYDELERNYEKQLKLYAKGAISNNEVEQLKNQLDIQAKALKQTDDTYTIKAPFSGVITELMVKKGSEVSPESPLFSIAKTDKLTAEFYVTANDIANIYNKMPVEIIIGDTTVLGKVKQKSITMDALRRAYKVEAIFDNNTTLPLAGRTLEIKLVKEKMCDIVSIPWEVIKQQDDVFYVYLNKNNTAVKQTVVIDRIVNLNAIIKSGLTQNNQLIISGMNKLDKNPNITVINQF
jgi:RND family efflux transporter MFP subunit